MIALFVFKPSHSEHAHIPSSLWATAKPVLGINWFAGFLWNNLGKFSWKNHTSRNLIYWYRKILSRQQATDKYKCSTSTISSCTNKLLKFWGAVGYNICIYININTNPNIVLTVPTNDAGPSIFWWVNKVRGISLITIFRTWRINWDGYWYQEIHLGFPNCQL